MRQLCKRCLHKSPGITTSPFLEKLTATEDRIWYAKATIQHGWSRNVLVHQIEADRQHRQGKAVANFDRTLPSPQTDPAQDIAKDPYNFDFLRSAMTRGSAILSGLCSITCANSSSNWALGSHSWEASIG